MKNMIGKSAGLVLLLLELVFDAAPLSAAESKQAEWERTVRAAEQEGQVVVYIAGYEAVIEAGVFQKAYPKIKVTTVTGSGSQLAPRIATERRAEKYLADVYNGGGSSLYQVLYQGKMLDPLKPALLLPEVVDESKWLNGKHHYADGEGQYIFMYEGSVPGLGLYYNSKLVEPKEFHSYWDALNPKWKGRIAAQDPRFPGTVSHALRFFFYHPELGPKYLRRLLTETDLVVSRDNRQMIDWVASGKFAFCLFCRTTDVYQAMKQGLPFKLAGTYDFKEGASIVPITGAIALFNRAPHPNAARLFVNWFLSREGQTAYQNSKIGFGGADSLRLDVPKDDVPPEARRQPEGKYLMINKPEWFDMTPIQTVVKEALSDKQK